MNDLPLTPRVFLLLWALESGAKHGYRLLADIEELGQGRVNIGPASLYEAIQSLRRKGWIEPAPTPGDAASDDRRRRYFRLTRQGTEIMRAEADRLAELVDALRSQGMVDSPEAR